MEGAQAAVVRVAVQATATAMEIAVIRWPSMVQLSRSLSVESLEVFVFSVAATTCTSAADKGERRI